MTYQPNMTRRAALAALAATASVGAFAQTQNPAASYPQKVVKIIVPYGPGTGSDVLARILAEHLGPRLGQAVIVENKAGASGLIGTQFVSNATADGYTLMMAGPTLTINSATRKTPYNPVSSFAPISQVGRSSVVLVVHPSVPANSLTELVAYLKEQGDNATYSSAGVGSAIHLYSAQFQQVVGSRMRHIPSKGVAGAVMDVVQNQVTMTLATFEAAAPLLRGGRLKALAQTGEVRSANLPDVPTFAEGGVPGFRVELWYGMFAPAATSPALVERLNRELRAVVALPTVKTLFAAAGTDTFIGTTQELGKIVRDEFATWSELTKRMGIKAE
ncbi:MAG: tripartite tricarboxylate transporter substrate binding protein [Xanthomonadaceae bacterium]|nr:tripartite tricarboxylate transporter substrate binding protein [Xanthomonadaceae bacterium]